MEASKICLFADTNAAKSLEMASNSISLKQMSRMGSTLSTLAKAKLRSLLPIKTRLSLEKTEKFLYQMPTLPSKSLRKFQSMPSIFNSKSNKMTAMMRGQFLI